MAGPKMGMQDDGSNHCSQISCGLFTRRMSSDRVIAKCCQVLGHEAFAARKGNREA